MIIIGGDTQKKQVRRRNQIQEPDEEEEKHGISDDDDDDDDDSDYTCSNPKCGKVDQAAITRAEQGNVRRKQMDQEMNEFLWEFEIDTNNQRFSPIAREVLCDYEPRYQEKYKEKKSFEFETFEVRQLQGSPKDFFYTVTLTLDSYTDGVIGYQVNKETGMKRRLRRWKTWQNSDTNYPSDPWVDPETKNPFPRPPDYFKDVPDYVDIESMKDGRCKDCKKFGK